MAGTTTNNSWDYPTSTDLVTNGALAIQTLADEIDTSVGTGLLAWQTYAPTLSGGWANGNGTYSAQYAQVGKIVHVRLRFNIGSTTTKGTNCVFSLPVTAKNTFNQGLALLAIGGTNYQGIVRNETTTQARILTAQASGTYLTVTQVTATIPDTWATSDTITFSFTYEAA